MSTGEPGAKLVTDLSEQDRLARAGLSANSSLEYLFNRIEAVRDHSRLLARGEQVSRDLLSFGDATDLTSGLQLRLPRLAETFALSSLAVGVLTCLVAVEYDPEVRALVRAIQRDAGRPCLEIGTIAQLLGLPLERVPEVTELFAPEAVLRRWALVDYVDGTMDELPFVSQKVRIAPRIARYLANDDALPVGMRLHGDAESAELSREIAVDVVERGRRALAVSRDLIIEIVGRPNTGRRAIAYALARSIDQRLLILDLRGVAPTNLRNRLAELEREALLLGALPALWNWDAVMPKSSAAQEEQGQSDARLMRELPDGLVKLLEEHLGPLILIAEEPEPLLGFYAPKPKVTLMAPFPTPSERATLMERALHRDALEAGSDVNLSSVTRRFALDPVRIAAAARIAGAEARARDPHASTVTHADVMGACKQQVRHDLKSLAERVEKDHKWEDLVIPVDVYHSLKEMVAYVKHSRIVYDDWGFAGRHSLTQGVSALFSGPPGTGKTMCASVMARELDMELFRVELSRVVSKWIGETEKNLGKVFDEACHSNAIILFDEADSLFAKRTEVKSSVDRYANLEVNYLLQRMEAFAGITILTTNFEDTLDSAFKRRLTFRLKFEKPDADARAALWEKVFPRECVLDADFDPALLGERFELSGGNIRNTAVRAAFMAAEAGSKVTMALCNDAAVRESREMGLLIREPARDRMAEDERPQSREAPAPSAVVRPPPQLVPITRPRNR